MHPTSLALVGHIKDYSTLEQCGVSFIRRETIITPVGSADISFGWLDQIPLSFGWRYGTDVRTGQRTNSRALILALALQKAKRIISLNGVGTINPRIGVGDFVVPHDFIDLSSGNVNQSYYDSLPDGIFVRMNPPFCPQLCTELVKGLQLTKVNGHDRGICFCSRGPRLETPAEVQLISALGADVVNMRIGLEAALSRELELCYASLCFVINYGEGRVMTKQSMSFSALQTGFNQTQLDKQKGQILTATIRSIYQKKSLCLCTSALAEVRNRGRFRGSATKYVVRLFKHNPNLV